MIRGGEGGGQEQHDACACCFPAVVLVRSVQQKAFNSLPSLFMLMLGVTMGLTKTYYPCHTSRPLCVFVCCLRVSRVGFSELDEGDDAVIAALRLAFDARRQGTTITARAGAMKRRTQRRQRLGFATRSWSCDKVLRQGLVTRSCGKVLRQDFATKS